MVRLPEWKLLVYIGVCFAGYAGLLAAAQAVDPLRPFSNVRSQGEGMRDEISEYCATGKAGAIIMGITGGLLVRRGMGFGGQCGIGFSVTSLFILQDPMISSSVCLKVFHAMQLSRFPSH